MKVINCIQRSPEWFQAKCGKSSSSRISDILSKYKSDKRQGEDTSARWEMKRTIATERVTERIDDHYVSKCMADGSEFEPFGRTAYELETGYDVRLVGFVEHPTIEWAGCSPDGLIGKEGVLEIKCPKDRTHFQYLENHRFLLEEYSEQCYWHLACTEYEWCDLVSWNRNFPKAKQLLRVRIMRDPVVIAGMNMEVRRFNAEVEELIDKTINADTYYERKLTQSIALVKGSQVTV